LNGVREHTLKVPYICNVSLDAKGEIKNTEEFLRRWKHGNDFLIVEDLQCHDSYFDSKCDYLVCSANEIITTWELIDLHSAVDETDWVIENYGGFIVTRHAHWCEEISDVAKR